MGKKNETRIIIYNLNTPVKELHLDGNDWRKRVSGRGRSRQLLVCNQSHSIHCLCVCVCVLLALEFNNHEISNNTKNKV